MQVTEYIDIDRFNVWMGLFRASNSGRFLQEPFVMFDKVEVRYSVIDDDGYINMRNEWERLNTPIIETRRGFWKRIKVKLGLLHCKTRDSYLTR